MMFANNYGNYGYPGMFGGGFMSGFTFFLVPLLVWSLFWKGWALWKAAKNDSKGWFVALLLINTLGILDILYIYVFGKVAKKSSKRK
ncbi:MAG TPA: DUF5652 family protein [Patescibacteria group bacterium]|nr:DUF5652 family protein [Patescibacteria group bacterium]